MPPHAGPGGTGDQLSIGAVLRRFVLIAVPMLVLVGLGVAAIYITQRYRVQQTLAIREQSQVRLQSEMITADFRTIISDLLLLSDNMSMERLLGQPGEAHRQALGRDYRLFAQRRQIYDQIRFIDEQGRETVRVNLHDGHAYIVPPEQLQEKANRYYFEKSIQKPRGHVFVSPFDLNVEQGRIERPIKPVIRFGTPVFDEQGRRRGIVVLNYLGQVLLEKMQTVAANAIGQIMLLNSEGYWLAGGGEADWAFMDPDRSDQTFARRFPHAWSQISSHARGTFTTEAGMFSFDTVYPVRAIWPAVNAPGPAPVDRGYSWKIVSHVPASVLSARSAELFRSLLQLYLVLALVLLLAAWLIARYHAARAAARRQLLDSERLAAIGEAMTGLAHESRNALQRSQACLEMLAKRVHDRPEAGEFIDRLARAQDDLHQLYERVRAYAAPIHLRREPCDVRRLIQQTWGQVLEAHPRQAQLHEQVQTTDSHVPADRFALQQVLRNVLENALSEENDAGVERQRVEVTVTFEDAELAGRAALRCVIADNGPGISAEQAEHIFEPFFTTRARGTGLGMAIAKRIIESHGGRIEIGPDSHRGARIVITLPRSMP